MKSITAAAALMLLLPALGAGAQVAQSAQSAEEQPPREIQPLPAGSLDAANAGAGRDGGEPPYGREAAQAIGDGSGQGGGHSSHYSNELPGSQVSDPREPELSGTTQSDNPLGDVGGASIETSADYGGTETSAAGTAESR